MENNTYYTYKNRSECENDFVLKEEKRHYMNCFITKEEATKHFKESEKIATKKYNNIIKGINKLKNLFGDFSYDCHVEVLDDSGLDTYMYIEINVNGYYFKFKQYT